MRDASSRPPLTATEASAPPQTENSIPVRQTHRRYRRTFLEERDPVGWRRELLEESSPNLRIGGPTRARPSPSAPSPPLLHASGLLLPGGGDSGCLLCRQAATPFADPHLSLPPPAMCYMVGGGTEGNLVPCPYLLSCPWSPLARHSLLLLTSPPFPFHSGDPLLSWPPSLLFLSCPPLSEAWLWLGCRGGSGMGAPAGLYIMYIFSCRRERSPCVPCAAHNLVCVWHCHVLGWEWGSGGGCVREGTHPRVFK